MAKQVIWPAAFANEISSVMALAFDLIAGNEQIDLRVLCRRDCLRRISW